MEAKVEFNSYVPANYHMTDMNDDVRSTMWPQFYRASRLNGGQCYNGFMQQNIDGYLECEKESLRVTMLKHEAIFRKQVSELHRLYQVQDLMGDLKREGMNHYSLLPMETMHRDHSLSKFDDSPKGWKVSFPSTSSSGHRESTSDTANMQLPLSLLKDNDVQVVSLSAPLLGLTKDSELVISKRNNSTWKSIDLQLPADMYIDVEDRELSVEEIKMQDPNVVHECEVKLTLGTGCSSSRKENDIRPGKRTTNGFYYHKMARSNDTQQGPHAREVSTSTYGVPRIFHDGFQPRHHSWEPNATSIAMIKDHNKDDRHTLHRDLLESECRGSGNWQFIKPVMGNNRTTCSSLASQHTNVKSLGSKKSSQLPPFLFPEHGQKDLQFPAMNLLNKASMNTTSFMPLTVSSSFPGPSPATNASDEVSSRTKFLNIDSGFPFGISSEAFLRDHTRQQVDTSSLTLFQRSDTCAGKKCPSISIGPSQVFGNGVSRRNGFSLPKTETNGAYHSFPFLQLGKPDPKVHDVHDVKLSKNDSSSMALPNGFRDDRPKIQIGMFPDKDHNRIRSSHCEGLSQALGYPASSIDLVEPVKIKKIKSETGMICEGSSRSQSNWWASFASLLAGKNQSGGVSEMKVSLDLNEPFTIDSLSDSSENCSGFDCSEKHQHTKGFTLGHPGGRNIEKETRRAPELYASQQFSGALSSFHKGKNGSLDDRDHQENQAFQLEPLAIATLSSTADEASKNQDKVVVHVGEETPEENGGPSLVEYIGNLAVSKTTNVSGKPMKKISLNGESGMVDDYSPAMEETATTMAAEVLMIISAVAQDKTNHIAWNQSEAPMADSLKWFADAVCSAAAELEPETGCTRPRSDDGRVPYDGENDDFETMTLMLTDTKMDEDYCYRVPPEEEKGLDVDASPAQRQPCRRSRRGRRQRNFQREILPSLVSLSRHEVTEDMQTIGCLMRFSGCQWQPTLAGKNGSPTRGRRPRCVAAEVGGGTPPVLQPASCSEANRVVGLKCLTWGKTTRRRRAQRCDATVVPPWSDTNKS